MSSEFVILSEGKLYTYENYDDIPQKFDNLIKFSPEIPLSPHSHEEHEEIESWQEKFKDLMQRETNGN